MLTGSDDLYLIEEEFEFACNILQIHEDVQESHWKLLKEALKKINKTNVYHNTSHILYMVNLFDCLDSAGSDISEKVNIYLLNIAILYHDCIYVAGATDNEEVSFSMVKSLLKEGGIERSKILYVRDMIMGETLKGLHAKIFKDLDYAIMGEHPVVYNRYSKEIEDEYRQIIGYDAYLDGRLEFLLSIDRNDLFSSGYLGPIFKNRASSNIGVEIGELNTMIKNRAEEK